MAQMNNATMNNATMITLSQFITKSRKVLGSINSSKMIADKNYARAIFKRVDEEGDADLVLLALSLKGQLGLFNYLAKDEDVATPGDANALEAESVRAMESVGWELSVNRDRKTMFDDAQLTEAFKGTNFGMENIPDNNRLILKGSLFKAAVGYHNGHTITQIMMRLGLISTKSSRVTKLGLLYLREVQHEYEIGIKKIVRNKELGELHG